MTTQVRKLRKDIFNAFLIPSHGTYKKTKKQHFSKLCFCRSDFYNSQRLAQYQDNKCDKRVFIQYVLCSLIALVGLEALLY